MEKTIKITNETGLHARPAAILAKTAAKFSADINIKTQGKDINAKSIMNILSAGLKKDDEITIVANGTDEKEAVEAIVNLFNSNFKE